jgi:methylated-DNA-[protein]-cysteine S-methyltransferase
MASVHPRPAAAMPQLSLHTPCGVLTLTEEDEAIVALDWGRGRDQKPTPLLRRAAEQLQDYFDGIRAGFDLPLNPAGTPFRRRVWAAMRAIPPAETRSYAELARLLGSAPRAVGQACGANPIPILIPCHRVVAADGSLGGLATKRFLLDLERHAFRRATAAGSEPQGRTSPS